MNNYMKKNQQKGDEKGAYPMYPDLKKPA